MDLALSMKGLEAAAAATLPPPSRHGHNLGSSSAALVICTRTAKRTAKGQRQWCWIVQSYRPQYANHPAH